MVTVVIAGAGPLASALVNWYRDAGAAVVPVSFDHDLGDQVAAITGPVDLLIVADGFEPTTGPVATLDRAALAAAMHRLTYLPFRLAAVLKRHLAEAQGRAVLLSRSDARIEVPDPIGRTLDRPFRTAAHTLWRSLSVEWREAGITVGLVALNRDSAPDVDLLVAAMAAMDAAPFPVELTSVTGVVLGW